MSETTIPTAQVVDCPVPYLDYCSQRGFGSMGKKVAIVQNTVMQSGHTTGLIDAKAGIHDRYFNSGIRQYQGDKMGLPDENIDGCPGPQFIQAFYQDTGIDINALWTADNSPEIDLWMGPDNAYEQSGTKDVLKLHQPTDYNTLEQWFAHKCCVPPSVMTPKIPLQSRAVFFSPVRFKRLSGGNGVEYDDDTLECIARHWEACNLEPDDPVWVIDDLTRTPYGGCWKDYDSRFIDGGKNIHPYSVLQIAELVSRTDPHQTHVFAVSSKILDILVWKMASTHTTEPMPDVYRSRWAQVLTDGKEWRFNA